jgi:hypothetical protein
MNRCRNVRIFQAQAVIAPHGSWLIGESRFVQRSVEKFARAISGKDAPCAIRSVRGWRKPKNEQLGARIAESRNRFAPVRPIAKRSPLFSRHFFSILDEARALAARHDFLIQNLEQRFFFGHGWKKIDGRRLLGKFARHHAV